MHSFRATCDQDEAKTEVDADQRAIKIVDSVLEVGRHKRTSKAKKETNGGK
jgi:hypothetical protein